MAPLTPAAPLVNAHLCPGDQVPRVPAKTMSPVYWPQLCAQWLLRTDPVRHLRRHALYSSTLGCQESSVVSPQWSAPIVWCQEQESWGWGREPSELRPPHSSDLFVGRHGFCSSCFSLIVKFSFALNSLPLFSLRLYFFVKDKKVSDKEDQALSWITPTPNELLYLCVSPVFSWSQAPKSLTQWSMYGRGERPIKQLSSLLVN